MDYPAALARGRAVKTAKAPPVVDEFGGQGETAGAIFIVGVLTRPAVA